MVHALEIIHDCLVPGGVLIDIHPAGEMPALFVRTGASQSLIGWLQETDYFVEYRQADQAVAQAVIGGLFRIDDHQEIIFETQTGDMLRLVEFLQATWSDALFEQTLIERARQVQRQAASPSTIVLAERVQLLKLVSLTED